MTHSRTSTPGQGPGARSVSDRRPSDFLRVVEVARRFGVSARHVQKLLRKGLLPGIRVGRVWLVPRRELEDHLADLVRQARHGLGPGPR
ncbi:MAG: helix-turn-helix domain-containing protein [Planctomycetota bacterium]|nr:helix-turn-helix domain-containing protein [Planctomycetota bacterium]